MHTGILIGDPASPILWNIFLADLRISIDDGDVFLDGVRIPYLAQADDLLLMSTSLAGLQRKLEELERWCLRNGLRINVSKTFLMAFGPLPTTHPNLHLCGEVLRLVDSTTYVGFTITSAERNIFAPHRRSKASAARNIANTVLSLESYVGRIPPTFVINLYYARLDPYLTAGAMVDLDVDASALLDFENVQHTYLRRVLALTRRSCLTPLFTETGIWPIRYRRAAISLRYLVYLLQSPSRFATAALQHSITLARSGHPSWFSDITHALRRLPVPVQFDFHADWTPTTVSTKLLEHLHQSLRLHLNLAVLNSERLVVWKHGVLPRLPRPHSLAVMCTYRSYLDLPFLQRRAIARLLASCHPYAVERLRYASPAIPRHWRICRFCRRKGAVETETHIIFDCMGHNSLTRDRESYYTELLRLQPSLLPLRRTLDDWMFLAMVIHSKDLASITAEYVLKTFNYCAASPPLYIQSQDDYDNNTVL